MGDGATTIVCEGLAFAEGPRWHDGRLWFSDMHDGAVKTLDPATGVVERVVEIAGEPSGLGWRPDGTLLVVSMVDRRVLGWTADGGLTEVADLSAYTDERLNDMVVTADGRAYIGGFGFDLHGGGTPTPTTLLTVGPDGAHGIVADDMAFPNGMVITPDGTTLIVGESFGLRLTAFTIDAATGALHGRRVWADLSAAGATPDGICLDADGCVWVSSPGTRACLRVREGGEIVDRISTEPQMCIACMLGGDDRRTLFVLTSKGLDPARAKELRTSRIESLRVDVPGAGWP
jgi:sugar lactone lactonase YvrE